MSDLLEQDHGSLPDGDVVSGTQLAGLRPRILGIGTAVPPDSYTQQEILDLYQIEDPRIRSVFLNSAIARRNLCLPPADDAGIRPQERQGELLRKHKSVGLRIGRAAIDACLERSNASRADVRYLCCVSSTGFITPGFSALLIKELELARSCSRLDVVGMGCNAGLNAMSAVAGWSAAHPDQLAIMLCVEVCSAAYVFDGTMRTSVVNSLFADGAAAISFVAGQEDRGMEPEVLGFASCIIPEAVDAMRYEWDDDASKFSFFLDPDVPYVVGAHAEQSLHRLLDGSGVRRSEVAHWIVHSGGKKVIDSVRVNLGLTRHDVRHTTGVLHDHGNLSSGSFLFSLERLLREDVVAVGDHGVLMTMGPGSTIEMALVRW